MTEPPAKRARRVDSSAMWDQDDRRTRSPEVEPDYTRSPRREHIAKDDGRRDGPRDDRRYRSRSRDRRDRRRDRSRSRDRRDRDRRDRDGRGMRDRERSVSRDRHYDRRGYPLKGDRFRSRSPIPNGNRDRSRTPPPRGPRNDRRHDRRDHRGQTNGATDAKSGVNRHKDEMDVDSDGAVGEDDVEAMMRRSMGFTKFRSTKNTKVPGNDIYGVRKEKKTEYRQYMNRVGGFNRPLSPSR
ncbi:SNUT3/LISCH7 family protein [Aspergillus luchuensis]|uniref:U4/U6.U5 small nuclear ribonucleoprotein 27kDa protein domain-containing protein n=1 Tax=Aspergillus kawachii TaxID=1069201 RepID=A0A146FX38_ASPKA|nr:uncharacterized protein AKAW2_60554A [Aspergillus luchuensis]BCS02290.1 hypothetical protein AKAW2_60554A [Aspergillus luchuensis]BCS13969.1 hypothetical protein ALUC_60525A [Aspergillus luchuensis]GAA90640.1 hypothetical protein AKAW_08754 [Aspergillus luchuensis IFO 4308]GAT29649.1 hypothetical protein RIB2604_03001820 [Aspergillus luchuensis]